MFKGGTKGQHPRPMKRIEAPDNAVTILTSGCHFTGKLYCTGSTRVGGVIEGEIISEGVLIVEERAHIMANIRAEEIIVQGRIEGKLIAEVRAELCQKSSFTGDIETPMLAIKEGASFNGRSTMARADHSLVSTNMEDARMRVPEVSANHLDGMDKPDLEVSLL